MLAIKRLVFMDVDGVLNSEKTVAKTPTGYTGISSDKVKLLKHIIDETHAQIILSSSWRTLEPNDIDYKYLVKQLKYKGLRIADKTSRNFGYHRGKQVKEYLDNHPEITDFVILDDEFIQEFTECNLVEHLIHTDYTTGLTKQDTEKAIKILNGQFDYINCGFTEEELKLIQGALKFCEEKQLFNLEETDLKSLDLRFRIKQILKKNQEKQDSPHNQEHFGREI